MRLSTFVCLAAGLAAAGSLAAQEAPDAGRIARIRFEDREVRTPVLAARLGLHGLVRTLLKETPEGTLPEGFPFDIKDVSELRHATLGESYEVHTVHPSELLSGGQSLENMVRPTGIHNFFVKIGSQVIGQVEVALVDGRWEMTAAGFAPLAQEVHQVASQEPGFRFVRIYQATSDLIQVSEGSARSTFVPLTSARHSLKLVRSQETPRAGRETYAGDALLSSLQACVQANLNLVQ